MSNRLSQFPLIAFVNISDPARAKDFYVAKLGLPLLREELPFALVLDAHGIMLRLAIGPKVTPLQGTILGWRVPHIETAYTELNQAGVEFEKYPFVQEPRGIWTVPDGSAKVAWFKDPDGNILSISEHSAP